MYTLCSISFETTHEYQKNLEVLLTQIKQTPNNTLIVAPEVCLSGFDYENFESLAEFSLYAIEEIKKVSYHKIIILTIIEKREKHFFNFVKVFHNGEMVYERAKAKLFRFGDEHKYFEEGNSNEVAIIEIDGMKIGILICFELRFKELWQKLEGSDIIAIPAWWGVLRTEHFKTLTRALAILNQCFVVASDSLNQECSKMSAIVTPQGEVSYNGNKLCLRANYNKKEIALMRRYMDVGIG